jgi:hypothetical protein
MKKIAVVILFAATLGWAQAPARISNPVLKIAQNAVTELMERVIEDPDSLRIEEVLVQDDRAHPGQRFGVTVYVAFRSKNRTGGYVRDLLRYDEWWENGKIGSSLADENALVHLCPSEHYTWTQCVQKMDEFSDRYKKDLDSGTMSNLTAEIKAWHKAQQGE